jgi:Domain of unknown function (DUF5666)
MKTMPKASTNVLILALCLTTSALCPPRSLAAPVQDAQAGAAKPVSFLGTVEAIDGKTLTVKNNAGVTMQVAIQDNARLLRIEPGQTNLQGANPLNLPDLQVGDRVLATGAPSADGKQIAAARLVAIKKTDIAQKQEQEREDWQKNGVGGLVQSIDPAAGTVTISLPGKRTLTIQASKSTIIRRYAPGSVKFDDAKPAPLADTKPGDQLRARGTRSADGTTFAAEEIVSGSFRNIAGTIVNINSSGSSFTVTDLATKHPVVIQVTPDTQIKKLDPMVAQRIAMRLKGPGAGGPGAPGGGGSRPAGAGAGEAPGRPMPDPQQILARAPSVTLKSFAKGDAVMLVATEGTTPGPITAVTVVGGVEPMLQASTSGSQAMLSSAWNLNGGGGGGDEGGAAPQ